MHQFYFICDISRNSQNIATSTVEIYRVFFFALRSRLNKKITLQPRPPPQKKAFNNRRPLGLSDHLSTIARTLTCHGMVYRCIIKLHFEI